MPPVRWKGPPTLDGYILPEDVAEELKRLQLYSWSGTRRGEHGDCPVEDFDLEQGAFLGANRHPGSGGSAGFFPRILSGTVTLI